MKYIIGNWKSNKNSTEVADWFKKIADLMKSKSLNFSNLEIIICPPFLYLPQAKAYRDEMKLPIKIGAQDVSPFSYGAYTGEIASLQLKDFAEYVIIGHSERRNYFKETDDMLSNKVREARRWNLQEIYCIQDEATPLSKDVTLVAYEPVYAIGTGIAETPQKASSVALSVKKNRQVKGVIYGGSVKPDNILSFLTAEGIDGVLPGGASLNPESFWELIVNAASI